MRTYLCAMFAHDQIHESVYSLMSGEAKQQTHLHLGHLLLEKADAEERKDKIFEITDHLNIGTHSMMSSE